MQIGMGIFYDIGNFVPHITKPLRGMRTRAKKNYVASDRARRENVPKHILYFKMTEKGNDSDERKITKHQGRGVKGY